MVSQFELQKHKRFLISQPVKAWLRENLGEKYSERFITNLCKNTLESLSSNKNKENILSEYSFVKVVNCFPKNFSLFYFSDYCQLVLLEIGREYGIIHGSYPKKVGLYDGVDVLSEIMQEM